MKIIFKKIALIILICFYNIIAYSQIRKNDITKDNVSKYESTFHNSNDNLIHNHINDYILEKDLRSTKIVNKVNKNFDDIFRDRGISFSELESYSFSGGNEGLEKIKAIIFSDLDSSKSDKVIIDSIKSFMNKYRIEVETKKSKKNEILQIEDLKLNPLYEALLEEKPSGSYYPEKLAVCVFLRIYLDKIAGFNFGIRHTALVLNLLNDSYIRSGFGANIPEKTFSNQTKVFLINQYYSLIYDSWKYFSSIRNYKFEDRYFDDLLTSFHLFDKIRNDNPDIGALLKLLSTKYDDFRYHNKQIFDGMSKSQSMTDIKIITEFSILNLLKANKINQIFTNLDMNERWGNNPFPESRSISIDKYKAFLIKEGGIISRKFEISIKLNSNNTCIKESIKNVSFNPKVLFREYLGGDNWASFSKNFVFTEKNNKVSSGKDLVEMSNLNKTKTYPNNNLGLDIYENFLFAGNQNTNVDYYIRSFQEVADSISVYNQKTLKKVLLQERLSDSYTNWYDDKFLKDSEDFDLLINNFVNLAISNYDSVHFDGRLKLNNKRLLSYMTKVENKANISNMSLTLVLTNYFESIITKSIAPKPIDLIKKDLILYFDNIYNSIIKKKQTEKVELLGNIEYRYSKNDGYSSLIIFPNQTINLTLSIFINGERMNQYLDGKLVKSTNGNYQIITNKGVFNVQFRVSDCGVKSIELSGTGNNSTILAIFRIE